MDLEQLQRLLAKGEDLHTEFKRWPVQPDDVAATLVAFANTDGGRLILGVDDEGKIVGVPEFPRVVQAIDNISVQNCQPPVTVVQEVIHDPEGRAVVVVQVPKGDERPYRTHRGAFFIRTASGRRQASRQELLRLFQETESLYYDEHRVHRARLDDLDPDAVKKLLRRVQDQGLDVEGLDPHRLLVNWRLAAQAGSELIPTLAGVLFLAREPQHFFPYAYVSALRIAGRDISTPPIDQKRVEGRLLDVIEDSLRFLNLHLMRRHEIRDLEPEVKPELPALALREVMVNAVAHRDYTIWAPIRLIVYDDRVEVRTPGGLPNTVTLEALRIGTHVLRNPMIYNVLLRVGLVTDAGSGIPRMIRLVRRATGHEPAFSLEGNEFVVALPRARPRRAPPEGRQATRGKRA